MWYRIVRLFGNDSIKNGKEQGGCGSCMPNWGRAIIDVIFFTWLAERETGVNFD
jgi:hypothetical protein